MERFAQRRSHSCLVMQRTTRTLCAVAAPALLALALTCLLAPVNAGLWSSPETKEDPPVLTAKPVALVTGMSGMIGSFVARELLARGYEVHGVVRYRTHWGNLRGEQDGRAPSR